MSSLLNMGEVCKCVQPNQCLWICIIRYGTNATARIDLLEEGKALTDANPKTQKETKTSSSKFVSACIAVHLGACSCALFHCTC